MLARPGHGSPVQLSVDDRDALGTLARGQVRRRARLERHPHATIRARTAEGSCPAHGLRVGAGSSTGEPDDACSARACSASACHFRTERTRLPCTTPDEGRSPHARAHACPPTQRAHPRDRSVARRGARPDANRRHGQPPVRDVGGGSCGRDHPGPVVRVPVSLPSRASDELGSATTGLHDSPSGPRPGEGCGYWTGNDGFDMVAMSWPRLARHVVTRPSAEVTALLIRPPLAHHHRSYVAVPGAEATYAALWSQQRSGPKRSSGGHQRAIEDERWTT